MERVVVGAAELVDVHTGRSAHTAVVADEHVKVLAGETGELGNEVLHFPQKSSHTSSSTQDSLLATSHCHSQLGSLSVRRWESKKQQTWLMEQLWEKPGVVSRMISPGDS